MGIIVIFPGMLSEISGTYMKVYNDVPGIDHLKLRLADDFPEIMHYNFRISVNNEITDDNIKLKDGDEIILILQLK